MGEQGGNTRKSLLPSPSRSGWGRIFLLLCLGLLPNRSRSALKIELQIQNHLCSWIDARDDLQAGCHCSQVLIIWVSYLMQSSPKLGTVLSGSIPQPLSITANTSRFPSRFNCTVTLIPGFSRIPEFRIAFDVASSTIRMIVFRSLTGTSRASRHSMVISMWLFCFCGEPDEPPPCLPHPMTGR